MSYGAEDNCWISPLNARLVVYIVPSLCMNYGSFLLISTAIVKTKREKRKDHNDFAKKDRIKFSKMGVMSNTRNWRTHRVGANSKC